MSNNPSLRQAIINALELNLEAATKAAESARQTATHTEAIAENKYDTFGLEASYLAHGLSVRAKESQKAIAAYTSLPFKEFNHNDSIGLTALVTLLTEDNNEKVFFIGPEGGGLTFNWQDKNIMLITPNTPLGMKLLGKRVDDTIEVMIDGNAVSYEILSLDN